MALPLDMAGSDFQKCVACIILPDVKRAAGASRDEHVYLKVS